MLSGANLSEEYFNTRQDRYMIFENYPTLAGFIRDIFNVTSRLEYINYLNLVFT
jgi:hypothetical protein